MEYTKNGIHYVIETLGNRSAWRYI